MKRCDKCNQVLPLSKDDVTLIQDALRVSISVTEIANSMERPRKTIYRIKERMEVNGTLRR
jgi:predicted transcriptional regulator